MNNVRIVYHCPCPDGVFGALAAHLHFKSKNVPDLKYIPNLVFKNPSLEDFDLNKDTLIYFIDCTPHSPLLETVAENCKKIIILDHHKTAFEDVSKLKENNLLPANVEAHYFMEKSGATVAFDYFDGIIEEDRSKLKEIYSYIEDNDLWRRALPNSKMFAIGLAKRLLEYNVNINPQIFQTLMELNVNQLVEEGIDESSKGQTQSIIDEDIEKSFKIQIEGFGSFLAVLTEHGELRSEMGHQLALKSDALKLRGIGAIVYKDPKMNPEELKVSLRSLPEEDTSIISKHFGGGGHKNASSFVVNENVFNSWKVQE